MMMVKEFSTTEILVCNQGVPSCIMYGDIFPKPVGDIHDEDIMNTELYPMSYEDAMELEAMDAFNWEMQRLSELEESEELHRRLESRIIETKESLDLQQEMTNGQWKKQHLELQHLKRHNQNQTHHRMQQVNNYRKPTILLHQPRKGRSLRQHRHKSI